ncbi:ROK family transcriptional regulator [Microbacterium marmarense]|uniref:ROK family transcriptional regulator n=1 Tax=Microbacterium marmarense TaxID=3122051 RepID=A0ABU8LS93_9MICO
MTDEVHVSSSPLRRFRHAHEQDIERALRSRGPLTRQELQDVTGLSRTTLYSIVNALTADGVIVESRVQTSQRRGRPASVLSLDPAAAQVIGVELGRSHIGVTVANLRHEIVAGSDRSAPVGRNAGEIGAAAIDAIDEALRDAGLTSARLDAIVVGTPLSFGTGAQAADRVREDVGARMLARYGVAPVFANNARLVALAEMRFGAGADVDDLIYLHLDEGVGGGVVLDRRIVDGRHGRAGELGHISVDVDGPPCWCGGIGCLERYLALPELAAYIGSSASEMLAHPGLVEHIDGRLGVLSRVVAGLLTTLDVRRVVLGGTLGRANGIAPRVEELVRILSPDHVAVDVDVRPAVLGRRGSAQGGVVLGLAAAGGDLVVPTIYS